MKQMNSEQIRQMWLDFFKSKGHKVEKGVSLVPVNDPTLLWINAGVSALKKYFDGSEIPECRRIVNAQKCIRTNDIEHVGQTDRHHTFFEMLGNFSIGDYFREEVIPWAVELLTSDKWFGFDKDKLYMTYFTDDLDSKKCWMKAGISEDHLIPLEGNFWEIGEGPCGPDTEIFYDRGDKYDPEGYGIRLLKEDMENDRYIEIWNIVFSQYNSEAGKKRSEYKELPAKNIDTGAGLERFCCIIQGTESNFETDLFWPMIEHVESLSGKKYLDNKMAFRVIADHVRSVTFALADGENFSNEGRGYVLRRLLRRACRYGKVLGINKPFLYLLVKDVANIMKGYYPYLSDKISYIEKMIESEEIKFLKTLQNGEIVLNKMINNAHSLSGEDMFLLYDTYGFPKELTMEICDEQKVKYDITRFNQLMEEQKNRAREARGNLQSMNKQSKDLMDFTTSSEFLYDGDELTATVIGLFKDGEKVDSISNFGEIIFDKTIFYAESGGQVADTGTIENDSFNAKVNNVIKAPNKQNLHFIEVMFGEIKIGDKVNLKLDAKRRQLITRNHSSVHLLQKALEEVVGSHIAQHGSYVCPEYIHFDFNHYQKVSEQELLEVEKKVNNWISDAIVEETKVLPIDEAKKLGAKALFNDKYGDTVRVVMFGDVSKEFCGGTHVSNTKDIGLFTIISEESVAAGIRRITATSSLNAYLYFKKKDAQLNDAKIALNAGSTAEVNSRLNALINEKNNLKKQLDVLNQKIANYEADNIANKIIIKDDISYLLEYVKGADRNSLLSIFDTVKQKYNDYVIALVAEKGGAIIVGVNGKAKEKYHAGNIVKSICAKANGSGGGRDEFASGALKDLSCVEELLKEVKNG